MPLQGQSYGNCRACNKRVRWVETKKGKLQPLDPDPAPGGNILLDDAGVAHQVNVGSLLAVSRGPLYMPHFATCSGRGLVAGETQRAMRRTRAFVDRELDAVDQVEPKDLETVKRFFRTNARLRTGARWR